MHAGDLVFILPHILIAAGAVVLMLVIAFYRNYTLSFSLALASLAGALGALIPRWGLPGKELPLVTVDGYGVFFSMLLIVSTIAVTLMSHRYLRNRPGMREEYFLLLLLACLGTLVLVCSSHMASLFLGLEVLGVSLYTLISYQRVSDPGLEAGIKYLILAGAASAFLLFGIALLYYDTGSMWFADLTAGMGRPGGVTTAGLAGSGLLLAGIGFKLGVVPFHMWTPDVFEGAPAPVTAFIATVSKGSMFALLVRFFAPVEIAGRLLAVFTLIAIASMLAGNLLALFQDNVKRILAYSSIAHMGYTLVAFLSAGSLRITAVTLYLLCYFISAMGAFGVVIARSGPDREADHIQDYKGLFARSPWLTLVFSLFLISLAGLPLTAGFIGKFFVMRAGVGSNRWLLIISLIAGSAIGLFYYLKLLVVMYIPAGRAAPSGPPKYDLWQTVVLAFLAGSLVWLGLNPSGLIRAVAAVAMGMGGG
jgi:NADH-quinone oxidoreductase subunit N